MSLNSSPLNVVAVNSIPVTATSLSAFIVESILGSDVFYIPGIVRYSSVLEGIIKASSFNTTITVPVSESTLTSSSTSTLTKVSDGSSMSILQSLTAIYTAQLLEDLTISEDIIISRLANITDNILLSVYNIYIYKAKAIIEDIISSKDLLQSSATYHRSLITSFIINSSLALASRRNIVDNITTSTDIKTVELSLISDMIDYHNLLVSSSKISRSIKESLYISTSLAVSLILRAGIVNSITIKLVPPPPTFNSSTYVLSTESQAVSTYTNYNFKGSCTQGNRYLFYNDSGIYLYGGEKDDGADIISYIETAAMNFGTTNKKSIPNIYIGYSSKGDTLLKVRLDGKGEYLYRLSKSTDNLQLNKVAVGKGLIGTYFQFELISPSSSLKLETLEFLPVILNRKI